MFKISLNDTTGRYLGEMIFQIQCYVKIGLNNSGGVSQVRGYGDFSRGFGTGCKNKDTKRVESIFYELSE